MSFTISRAGARVLQLVLASFLATGLALGLTVFLAFVQPPLPRAQASGFIIVVGPGSFPCTNAGVQAAIDFATPGDTIELDCVNDIAITSTLVVTKNLTFVTLFGYYAGEVTSCTVSIRARLVGTTRILSVTAGTQVTTDGISLIGPLGTAGHAPSVPPVSTPGGLVYLGTNAKFYATGSAFCGGATSADGGDIFGDANSSIRLKDSIVVNGSAANGGNIACRMCDLNIFDSEISDGNASGNGGGIYSDLGLVLLCMKLRYDADARCLAARNMAGGDGGMLFVNGGQAYVGNVLFQANVAASYGGAIANLAYVQICAILSGTAPGRCHKPMTVWNVAPFAARMSPASSAPATAVNLVFTPTRFISNSAANGGALFNLGTMTVTNALFARNSATFGGGASNGASLDLSDTIFVSNTADNGAAIQNTGVLTVYASSLISNVVSSSGGGLFNSGSNSVRLTNVTLALNRAPNLWGGGIFNSGGAITLTNSTVLSNSSSSFDGLTNFSGEIDLLNTIVAFNTPANCFHTTSLGHNLDSAQTCILTATGDLTNTNPKLGPLADHGGASETYAPLPGSPVIDAGANSGCPVDDERGAPRPFNGTCDIGAVEAGSQQTQTIDFPALGPTPLSQSPLTLPAVASSGLPVSYTASGSCSVTGSQLTLTGAGSCTVTAHQAGDANYLAAVNVGQTFLILTQNLYLPLIER